VETTKDIDIRQSSVDLWIGVLAGPLVYAAAFTAKFALIDYVCRNGASWLLIAIAIVALIGCAWGCFCAKRGDAGGERAHVMSVGGRLISFMFALAVLATIVPEAFLRPCD
jgi:hypothetical protein